VRAATDAGRLPLVLAGSCVTCQGVLAGFEHSSCGAVWLDAHADFNTPDTAASGFFPGMSLAIATGHCFADYWGEIGDNTPLCEENVVMLGVRDVSPEAERERIDASRLRIVAWRDGRPAGDVTAALDKLAERVADVYLHIDFDAFAPEAAPGVVDEPVPGGLSAEDADAIIGATAERFVIRAVTLATYTPANDTGEKTLQLALRLVQSIGEAAGRAPPRFRGSSRG
jgi:arginase